MSAAKNKAKNAKNDTRPRQDFNAINQLGLKAQSLVTQHQAQIGTRLSAAFITSFGDDLVGLVNALPAVITSRDGKVQLTAAQGTALLNGYKLVKGLRMTVKGHQPNKDVLLAYGVGSKMNKVLVKDVTAAIQTILDRVTSHPAEATAFDIVSADVKALHGALSAIMMVDQAQETARVAAPQTTAQRNITARRLLAGIKKIAGAGMRAFVGDATVYANFESLVTKAGS